MQNAPREHSATLMTFIKLPFVVKIFVLSIFEWSFYTGFTVHINRSGIDAAVVLREGKVMRECNCSGAN